MRTKEITIDEKDWFNIDEEIDPKCRVSNLEVLEGLRIDFVHNMLELYRQVKIWKKKLDKERKKDSEANVDFEEFYNEYVKRLDKYPKHQYIEDEEEEDFEGQEEVDLNAILGN